MRMNLSGKGKDIRDGDSNLWHQKYSLSCTKVIGFVSCRVKSKVLGIGVAQHSWGDVKRIKSGNRSDISSDVSENQSIVYTSACIESAIIEQYNLDKNLNDRFSSHTWNEEDDVFYQQLEKWVVEIFILD